MSLPTFRYVTLAEAKAEVSPDLLTDASITDEQVLKQIERASDFINRTTEQVFQPVPEVARVSGRGTRALKHPRTLPFLDLAQVARVDERSIGEFKSMDRIIPGMRYTGAGERWGAVVFERTTEGLIILGAGSNATRKAAWEPGEYTVNLLDLLEGFTAGWRNIELSGWFGWLDGRKKVRMALNVAIPAATTGVVSVVVDDIVDPDTGDILEVGDTIAITTRVGDLVPKSVELAIVQSVAGSGPYTLTVDPLHPLSVEATVGTEVHAFGRVPTGVNTVAAFVVGRMLRTLAFNAEGNIVGAAAAMGQLKSERVDNYSYTLGDTTGASSSGIGKYTGSAQMDLLLAEFARPTVSLSYF